LFGNEGAYEITVIEVAKGDLNLLEEIVYTFISSNTWNTCLPTKYRFRTDAADGCAYPSPIGIDNIRHREIFAGSWCRSEQWRFASKDHIQRRDIVIVG
jgi:hypothetical protein